MEIDTICRGCNKRIEFEFSSDSETQCPLCTKPIKIFLTKAISSNSHLDQCLICECEHVYRHRDFNRKLGVALVVIGIALAYFTYGISILVLTAFDFWLYKKVGEVISCYRCGTVYREPPGIDGAEIFNLSLADYYRSLEKK